MCYFGWWVCLANSHLHTSSRLYHLSIPFFHHLHCSWHDLDLKDLHNGRSYMVHSIICSCWCDGCMRAYARVTFGVQSSQVSPDNNKTCSEIFPILERDY